MKRLLLLAKNHQLLLTLLIVAFHASAQNPINDRVFGQNAWLIDNTNANPANQWLDGRWGLLKESGVTSVRIGGIAANFVPLYTWDPNTFQITSSSKLQLLIDSIRAHGMEPIVEVGFVPANTCGNSALSGIAYSNQAKIAGNLVAALNGTGGPYNSNKIKKWIIVEISLKLTPILHSKLTPFLHSKLTPVLQSKLTPLF